MIGVEGMEDNRFYNYKQCTGLHKLHWMCILLGFMWQYLDFLASFKITTTCGHWYKWEISSYNIIPSTVYPL